MMIDLLYQHHHTNETKNPPEEGSPGGKLHKLFYYFIVPGTITDQLPSTNNSL
jgi:hypothetical protein